MLTPLPCRLLRWPPTTMLDQHLPLPTTLRKRLSCLLSPNTHSAYLALFWRESLCYRFFSPLFHFSLKCVPQHTAGGIGGDFTDHMSHHSAVIDDVVIEPAPVVIASMACVPWNTVWSQLVKQPRQRNRSSSMTFPGVQMCLRSSLWCGETSNTGCRDLHGRLAHAK